jgi:hypothetical protein
MVRSLAKRVAATFVLVSIAAAAYPLAAQAQAPATSPTEVHYETAITTAYGSPYPIAGHLDLVISQDGIIHGYYHNAYQKAFIQVAGGRDGNYIWFDIGPSANDLGIGLGSGNKLHVVATMGSDGAFRGQLYPLFAAALNGESPNDHRSLGPDLNVTNQLAPQPQPTISVQYLFAAKPVDPSSEDYPFTVPSPSP